MRLLRRFGCWLRGYHLYRVGDILKAKRGGIICCKMCETPRVVRS